MARVKFLQDVTGTYDLLYAKDSVHTLTVKPSERRNFGTHYIVEGHGYGTFVTQCTDFVFLPQKGAGKKWAKKLSAIRRDAAKHARAIAKRMNERNSY